jgi:hypothetical protein
MAIPFKMSCKPAAKPATQKLPDKLQAQGKSPDSAQKIAASIGRAKYGNQAMEQKAAIGRKKAGK